MRYTLAILAALSLTGCVRSMDHVAALPVTDEAVTSKSIQEVRDCMVPIMDRVRARPVETGTEDNKRLAFVGETGTIALYDMVRTDAGTKVTAHRRKMIADKYEEARACYM